MDRNQHLLDNTEPQVTRNVKFWTFHQARKSSRGQEQTKKLDSQQGAPSFFADVLLPAVLLFLGVSRSTLARLHLSQVQIQSIRQRLHAEAAGSPEDRPPPLLVRGGLEPPDMADVPSPQPPYRLAPLLAEVEQLWEAIRRRHPDVPPAVIVLGYTDEPSEKTGHWGALHWEAKGARIGEVFIATEALDHGPEGILSISLHEAVHARASVHGLEDCTAEGVHLEPFKQLAEEMGLRVKKHATRGWATTQLAPGTAALYRENLARLYTLMSSSGLRRRAS